MNVKAKLSRLFSLYVPALLEIITTQKGKFRQTQLERFLRKESFLSQILNKHRIHAQHIKMDNSV